MPEIPWPTGPLDSEERSAQVPWEDVARYEATVQAVEAERDALAERVERYEELRRRISIDRWTIYQAPALEALRAVDKAAGR